MKAIKFDPYWVFVVLVFMIIGCQTSRIRTVSQRSLGYNKPGTAYMHGQLAGKYEKPEIYVKKKRIVIVPKDVGNETGSLFRLDDQRNYLFTSNTPYSVNQFINVQVKPVRRDDETDKTKGNDEKNKDQGNNAEESSDQFVKEMLKALPQLDPGDQKIELLSQLKMRIVAVQDNGDVDVAYKRTSVQGDQGNEIEVKARIPYAALISGRGVSTRDLIDVRWTESQDGELVERYSSDWQDEYSLRLSGFTEAKSIYAKQLEDKRKQLESVRENLRKQLVALGKERKTMADERSKLMKEKAELEDKLRKTEQEQNQNQKKEDSNTKPATSPTDKPGAKKDGAKGA